MSTASLLVGLALLLVVALFILRPVLTQTTHSAPQRGRPRSRRVALLAQKEGLLEEIRALEFDYETGKVPAEVYEVERARRMSAAADILRQLDQLPADKKVGASEKRILAQSRASAEIETAIAQLRADKSAVTASVVQPPAAKAVTAIPASDSSNGEAAERPQARYCPQCGQPTGPADRFCAYCGNPLKAGQATE